MEALPPGSLVQCTPAGRKIHHSRWRPKPRRIPARPVGGRKSAAHEYTSGVANEDSVLEETTDNLREAARRIRATQNLMHARGMTGDANYRELLTRLSTALAMTEAAYVEAKRRRGL